MTTNLKHMDEIVLNALAEVEVLTAMKEHYRKPKDLLLGYLDELEESHGNKAIIGIFGWILCCKYNNIDESEKWRIITEDLELRNSPTVTLETADFIPIAENYFINNFLS